MGLDMYLRLKEHSKCSVKGFGGDGDTYHRDPKDWVCVTKEYAVCDWRKANHIHQWFVQNVQDGNDDCGDGNYGECCEKKEDGGARRNPMLRNTNRTYEYVTSRHCLSNKLPALLRRNNKRNADQR